MKHARWHFISHAIHILMGPAEGEGGTGGGGVTSAPADSESRGLRSVSDAVAELERRERERRAAKKAEKGAKADKEPPKDGEDDDSGDDDADESEPQRDKRKANKDTKEKPAKANKPEADDSDDGADDDSEEDDDEGDDDSSEDDDADERDDVEGEPGDKKKPGDDDDDEPSLEIEHEGKKHRIPAALKDAFLRQADYTRKTQEVAQERQSVQAAGQQAQTLLQQTQQAQAALVAFAQHVIGEPPPLALAQQDPQTYLVQRGLYEQRLQQVQHLTEHGHALTRQQQELQQRQHQEHLQRQAAEMVKAMPELQDPAKRAAFRQQAEQVGGAYGFTPQEIAAISDHRMLLLLRDLAAARKQDSTRKQASESVRKKLANVPPKTAKPAAGGDQKGARNEEARRQFLKSGRSMKDVERYLRATGG